MANQQNVVFSDLEQPLTQFFLKVTLYFDAEYPING